MYTLQISFKNTIKPNLVWIMQVFLFSGKKACGEIAELSLSALYTTNHWQN